MRTGQLRAMPGLPQAVADAVFERLQGSAGGGGDGGTKGSSDA